MGAAHRFSTSLTGLLVLLGAVTACTPTIENISLRLSRDMNISVSGGLSHVSSDENSFSDSVARVIRCSGANVMRYRENGRTFFNMIRQELPTSELPFFERCFIRTTSQIVNVRRDDGLLWNSYVMTLQFREPTGAALSGSDKGFAMPAVLNVRLPGESLSFSDLSPRPHLDAIVERVASNEVNVRLRERADVVARAQAELRSLCGRGRPCPQAQREDWPTHLPIRLEFKSREYRYGANDLLAVLGLLFGSGLLVAVGRRLGRRRTQKTAPQ